MSFGKLSRDKRKCVSAEVTVMLVRLFGKPDQYITRGEVKKSSKKVKPGKTASLDAVVIEYLKR